MASPSSTAAMSDVENEHDAPSSPPHHHKSFMSNMTEDEDTRMEAATPEATEKAPRGKGRGARESVGQNASTIGKIRHLKKDDGDPLWRKDIQYDFLKA